MSPSLSHSLDLRAVTELFRPPGAPEQATFPLGGLEVSRVAGEALLPGCGECDRT